MENTKEPENTVVPERRRRRKRISTGDSEDLSDASVEDKKKESEVESELEPGLLAESEYESAEEEEDEDGISEEGGGEALSDDVIIEGYEGEREEGDGQEESVAAKEKALDDDEDRRNPQYIPKKGTFYEHDDRTVADEEDKKPEEENEEKPKRHVWKEREDRWMHDRYNEDDQAPKSREELVAIYGYDIRNEEGAPRARRRRRYGRGPNKYTRTWEDEGAYAKMSTRGGGGGGLGGRGRGRRPSEEGLDREETVDGDAQRWGREFRRRRNGEREDEKPFRPDNRRGRVRGGGGGFGGQGRRVEEPEEDFPPLIPHGDTTSTKEVIVSNVKESLVIKSSLKDSSLSEIPDKKERETQTEPPPWKPRGRGKVRGGILPNARTSIGNGGGNLKGQQHDLKSHHNMHSPGSMDVPTTTLTFVNSSARVQEDSLSHEFSKIQLEESDDYIAVQQHLASLQNKEFKKPSKMSSGYHQQSDRRQAVVPPRLQDGAANRSKRYSSQRQRVITDTPPPTSNFNQNASGYYETGYQQQVFTEAPPQPPPPLQPPVPISPPQIIPPATFAPPYPSPPAYAESFIPPPQPPGAPMFAAPPPSVNPPPVVPPAPPFIAPNATIMNYVPPPAQFTPAPFPAFQGFPPPPQPQEVYQGPGITYYNTHNQIPRPTPLKRPKAAIPIVPPPEKEVDRVREGDDKVDDSGLTETEIIDYHGDAASSPTPTKNDSSYTEPDNDSECTLDVSANEPEESIECHKVNDISHQQQVASEVVS